MNIFSFIILVPILVFYGAYITKLILLKKQGVDVNRLAKGDKPTRTQLLEIGLIIVTYGMALLQCFSLLGVLAILNIGIYFKIIGIAIAFIGTFFFIMALIAMKNSWRAGIDSSQKTTLRTDGILKFSRNPAFIGFGLFYIGIALALPNIILFTAVIIALLFFHLQILEEEKFLTIMFKDDYIYYKNKVRRYI